MGNSSSQPDPPPQAIPARAGYRQAAVATRPAHNIDVGRRANVSSVPASTNWRMSSATAHQGNLRIGETFSCIIIQSVPPLCIWITKHAKCPPIECRLEQPLEECQDCEGSMVDGTCIALIKGFHHGSVPVIQLEYKMRHDFSRSAVVTGQFWKEAFRGLFDGFGPSSTWILKELSPGEMGEMRKRAAQRETVNVRYDCETCGHCWTSRCGRALFVIDYDATRSRGTVNFTVFGQECNRCVDGSTIVYATALCYQQEVERILRNLYRVVGQRFFGFPKPPSYERFPRATSGGIPHERAHCEACKNGLCMNDLQEQLPANNNPGQVMARRICICRLRNQE